MIPLFKSQFSIGKSILTVDDIIDIAKYNNLEKTVLVEDSFYGFRDARTKFKESGLSFVFGIRLLVTQNSKDAEQKPSKLVFFAKNNQGFKNIRNLYTDAFTNSNGVLSLSDYDKSFFDDIKIAVPFYDSFVYQNIFHFGLSDLNLTGLDHFYFEEDNDHPFDFQIKKALDCLGVNTVKAKSIYYRNREDFDAFQMYKAVCNRSHGRSPTYSNPNLNNFCSNEFCWESISQGICV